MGIDSSSNSNFKSLKSSYLERQQRANPEQKLKDVANMYEKHFLGEMMKAMRGTVHESGFIKKNQAEKIFSEKLDQEYVEKWGDRGGIGLSDLIYKQLVEKYGEQMGIRAPVQRPHGPIKIDQGYSARVVQNDPQKISYRFDKELNKSNELHVQDRALVAPWAGVLLNKIALGDDQFMTEIGHDNGLVSQIMHKGWSFEGKVGDSINPGDRLGLLSPEAKSFFWNIQAGAGLQTLENSTNPVND